MRPFGAHHCIYAFCFPSRFSLRSLWSFWTVVLKSACERFLYLTRPGLNGQPDKGWGGDRGVRTSSSLSKRGSRPPPHIFFPYSPAPALANPHQPHQPLPPLGGLLRNTWFYYHVQAVVPCQSWCWVAEDFHERKGLCAARYSAGNARPCDTEGKEERLPRVSDSASFGKPAVDPAHFSSTLTILFFSFVLFLLFSSAFLFSCSY